MKLISGEKRGFMMDNAERGSKPRAYVWAIFAVAMTSLFGCASAPLAKKSNGLHGNPGPAPTGTVVAAPPPPPPNPDDSSAEIVIVAVPKPVSPITKNDAIDTDSAIRKESNQGEEEQRARGGEDPLQSSSGLELAGEGGAPGGGSNGVASNNKSRSGRGASGSPAPIPDRSGSTNTGGTGGTQIAAASEVRGSIDKAEIRRVVMAHAGEMKRCYEQGLVRHPDLEGRVALKFTIERTGMVVAVSVMETSLNDRQSELCMLRAASKWVFPKPSGDGLVTVSYPFIFKSAE